MHLPKPYQTIDPKPYQTYDQYFSVDLAHRAISSSGYSVAIYRRIFGMEENEGEKEAIGC